MKPLNYAILKYMTTVSEACTEDVMAALKGQYSTFRAFTKPAVLTALMTAQANGLVEESRFDLDENDEVRMYFRANAESIATINKYIPE
ncbi:hypothetical protein [Desulfovibrio intestinalis]|uniref:Uncharacterized protein n=1 Tax=Desulfovibrio intestinalis TaxID=58621 RepID=A0A7W8C279_9BACT|nr:hypothetical protein [Desulfovibrio intestinalis]MBB5144221.1 hypothetical protein [Desulfovibrio intestinalis]